MLKIAHRGASGYAPENTLEAFQKAIDLKADMIELDIHQHQGQLIVCHNPPHHKPGSSPNPLPLGERARVRGKWPGEREQTVPALQDVIRFVKGKIQLNIEIKEGGEIYPGIEKNLLSLLVQEQFVDQCVVSSFDAPTLRQIKSLTGRGEARLAPICGLIFDRQPLVHLQKAVEIGLDVIGPRWTICTPELVQQAKQKKKKIFVWTVNTLGQVEYFKKLGVDGIISDYPDIL